MSQSKESPSGNKDYLIVLAAMMYKDSEFAALRGTTTEEIKELLRAGVALMLNLGLFPSTKVRTKHTQSSETQEIQAIVVSTIPERGRGVLLDPEGLLKQFKFIRDFFGNQTVPNKATLKEVSPTGYKTYGPEALRLLGNCLKSTIVSRQYG